MQVRSSFTKRRNNCKNLMPVLLLMALAAFSAFGQTGSLRGQARDESGGGVPNAKITIAGPRGLTRTTTASSVGAYAFAGLPAGDYVVEAFAPGLALKQPVNVTLTSGVQTLDLVLSVALQMQEVTVEESGRPAVSTEAAANASSIVMRGTDLDALSDNPDDLLVDLQALAGPAAGPNGGSVFIDGFSGGQLPPKSSIREIRINQNPFSPEYDRLGFGRIEIFTKPGTDKFRGSLGYNFATDKLEFAQRLCRTESAIPLA